MLLLCGDIGGTKTILRLVEVGSDNQSFETVQQKQFVSAKFVDLVPMVKNFMNEFDLEQPALACFAIAGPVVNNQSYLTNLKWQLTSDRLQQELGIARVSLLNDFAANSYGVLGLKESELAVLQVGKVIPNQTIAVIGAGTGLGESFLIFQNGQYNVFPSEGGHIDFAPRNDLELELWQYLYQKLGQKHISVERVVSGQGIINIYQFLRDSEFAPENEAISQKIRSWETEAESGIDPGKVIAQGAQEEDDILCLKAIAMFVEAYGAAAGNLALKVLPFGGIYIAGGIAAKNLEAIKQGTFLQAFIDKGRMGNLLKDIPIYVVLNPQVGLLGSILYALQKKV